MDETGAYYTEWSKPEVAKIRALSLEHKEMNTVRSYGSLEKDLNSRWEGNLTDTSTVALWEPEQRTHLNGIQTPNPQKSS